MSNYTDYDVEMAIRFDPLQAAEDMIGDEDADMVTALGFRMAMSHGKFKDKMLSGRGDTHYNMKYHDFINVVLSLDFEPVYSESFEANRRDDEEPMTDYFLIFAHRDGMLLALDAYRGEHVNSASVYYNWKGNDPKLAYHHVSSGSYHHVDETGNSKMWAYGEYDEKDIYWSGDHDVREALIHKITTLRENGTFLSPWKHCPFNWLVHYKDYREKEDRLQMTFDRHIEVTKERLAKMPQWVRDMIGTYRHD